MGGWERTLHWERITDFLRTCMFIFLHLMNLIWEGKGYTFIYFVIIIIAIKWLDSAFVQKVSFCNIMKQACLVFKYIDSPLLFSSHAIELIIVCCCHYYYYASCLLFHHLLDASCLVIIQFV